jgi:hypothetical protein
MKKEIQELFESFNDSAINEKIFVYELHLREGETDYAGAGYYYFIGYDYNRPSWIAIQNFIDYKTPDKSSVNLPTPYFLDLNENTLESNTNINFSDLLKKFNKKTKELAIKTLISDSFNGGFLIYEGLTFDDYLEEGNGLVTDDDGMLVYIENEKVFVQSND